MKIQTLTLFSLVVGFSATASAQNIYEWNDATVPVVVESKSGIIFVGKNKEPVRAYKWKQASGKNKRSVFFTDLDADGKPEVVGAGKPLFTLATNSDPLHFNKKGCGQALVADFVADNKLDIACINGKNIEVFTHDLQFVWKSSIGRSYKFCRAGDVNGDLKADLECSLGKKWSRFDGASGELLAGSTDTEEVNNPVDPSIAAATSVIGTKTAFDLNADGTKKEVITADGTALFLGAARVALDGEPVSAIVKDLDGDKKPEVIAITKKSLYVIDGDGKNVRQTKLAKKFKRKPIAELTSVYANGFKDDKAAQEVVNKANQKLSNCYASQVRKNQFAGTGQMLMEVMVGAKGKVKKVQQHHSSLADKSVAKCAKGALKKLKFPETAADAGSVNVTMRYTFEDK